MPEADSRSPDPTQNPHAVRRPQDVDRLIGLRLREIRLLNGLTLAKLAELTDVSWRQLQKYEAGLNRVPASRLLELSVVLGVELSEFFDAEPRNGDTAESDEIVRLTKQVTKNFGKIADPTAQRSVAKIVARAARRYRQT